MKHRDKLIHSYSLVGYLLSPNQTIMDHAYENRSLIHHEAVVNLIEKLIVNPKLVGVEKSTNLAESISNFWDEYNWFVNKQRMFKFAHMLEPAAQGDHVPAYRWHQRWSLHTTKVLGKLACLVQSKILGIGTAEQNWKQVKLMEVRPTKQYWLGEVQEASYLVRPISAGKDACKSGKAIIGG